MACSVCHYNLQAYLTPSHQLPFTSIYSRLAAGYHCHIHVQLRMASTATHDSSEVDLTRCMHCRARSYSSSVMSDHNSSALHGRIVSSSSLPSMAASFSSSSEEGEGYFSFKSIGLHEPGEEVQLSYRQLNQQSSNHTAEHKVCIAGLMPSTAVYSHSSIS